MPVVPQGPIRSDSPDLPDSDIDIAQPKRGTGQIGGGGGTLRRSRSGRGVLPAESTVSAPAMERPGPHPRRGSFLSSILRRKKDTGSKISRDITESAARRDTRLERSTEQLTVMRTNSGSRLQKKGAASASVPSWPFPGGGGDEDGANDGQHDGPGGGNEIRRPATATGAAGGRPGLLKRRTTSQGVVPSYQGPASVVSAPDGQKKKKFGSLRKMLGIQN